MTRLSCPLSCQILNFIFAVFFCSTTYASVSVVFYQVQDLNGHVVQLEEDGAYYHVALQLEDGRWIQSHPRAGVVLFNNPSEVSENFVVLTNLDQPAIKIQNALPFLGLPFDYTYTWDDTKSTYCSKLVGQLLNISPLPMNFSSEHWKWTRERVSDGPGLSPDDLFRILKKLNFLEIAISGSCSNLLIQPRS